MQWTLGTSVQFQGIGLHTARPVRMEVAPAPRDHGVVFRRSDIRGRDALVPARWDLVDQTPLCTRLINDAGTEVSTVEHLMAALAGLGLTNVLISINGPEVPILDGSAAPFVRKLVAAGLVWQGGERSLLRILQPVEVTREGAAARLEPANRFEIDFEIDFAEPAIGRQRRVLDMRNGAFVRSLCDSRTFCRSADVEIMRSNGLAGGGTFDNAIVFEGDTILTPGGLRHADEPVRHKMLDALGDLSLAGMPILGRYVGWRSGHAMTNRLLRKLFDTPSAFEIVSCDAQMAASLPGAGVRLADLAACAA